MPKVALTREQKIKAEEDKLTKMWQDLTDEVDLELYRNNISKKAVAEIAGVDPSAISHQFKKGRITMSGYLAAKVLLKEQ